MFDMFNRWYHKFICLLIGIMLSVIWIINFVLSIFGRCLGFIGVFFSIIHDYLCDFISSYATVYNWHYRAGLKYEVIYDYYPNGQLWTETHLKGKKKHRDDGPAFSMYLEDGTLYSQMHYKNNKLHNANGYAFCLFDKDPQIGKLAFYLNGQYMDKNQYFDYLDHHIGVK